MEQEAGRCGKGLDSSFVRTSRSTQDGDTIVFGVNSYFSKLAKNVRKRSEFVFRKSLSEGGCRKNNDLISRSAAVRLFDNYCAEISPVEVIDEILNLPGVDAELVWHALWVGVEFDGYADGCPVYDLWECSACGHEHKGEKDTLTNYCPNCGARMALEE